MQVYIANNNEMTTVGGGHLPGNLDHIGKQLVIGNNALLTSLSGLNDLEYVGSEVSHVKHYCRSRLLGILE